MQTNRSNAGALVGGAIMIAFGLLALAGQIFRSVNWGFLWPFIVPSPAVSSVVLDWCCCSKT